MKTFGELLAEYMRRTGISDAELARSIGVSRITIFRWKEGSVARPRVREDVLHCAERLRLTPEERDLLLLAAGFAPESHATIPISSSTLLPPTVLSPANTPDNLPEPATLFKQAMAERDDPKRNENQTDADTSRPEERLSNTVDGGQDRANSYTPNVREKDNVAESETPQESQVAPTPSNEAITQPKGHDISPFPYLSRGVIILGALLVVGLTALMVRSSDIFGSLGQPTPTPSGEPSPTRTAIVIPVPQIVGSAQENELLIILSEFTSKVPDQYYDVPVRLKEALTEAFKKSKQKLRIEILRTPIQDEEEATRWLESTQAAVIFWGAYDSGRLVTYILDNPQGEPSQITRGVDSANNLATVINDFAPNDVKRWATAWAYLIQSEVYLGTRWQNLQQGITSINLQEGISALQEALKQGDLSDEMKGYAYLNEGKAYLNAKSQDTESARIALERALKLNPSTIETKAEVLFYLGYINEIEATQKRSVEIWDQAIDYYSQALTLKPGWSNIRFNRGNAYYARSQLAAKDSAQLQADFAAALADFTQVIDVKPANAGAYWNRATTYYDRNSENDLILAQKDIEQAVRLTSALVVTASQTVSPALQTLSPAHIALANQYFMVGLITLRQTPPSDWESAFRTMHELVPEVPDYLAGLCWGYAVTNNAAMALTECEALRTQVGTNFARSADSYAIALAQTGRYTEALAALELHITWLKTEPPQLYERYNGLLIEEWMLALRQEKNPFTPEVVEGLRRGK